MFSIRPAVQSPGKVPPPLGMLTVNELKSNVDAVACVVRFVLTVSSRPAVPVLLAPTSGAVYQKK
ncbi:hypothetical protein D3C84_1051580 [compost metagenome]